MRDHRAQELAVADQPLLANGRKAQDPDDEAGRDQAAVEALARIHHAHEHEFEHDHRRGHQAGHVGLVEAWMDVGGPVDHGVHQDVHGQERQGGHDRQAQVRPMVLMIFRRVLLGHDCLLEPGAAAPTVASR